MIHDNKAYQKLPKLVNKTSRVLLAFQRMIEALVLAQRLERQQGWFFILIVLISFKEQKINVHDVPKSLTEVAQRQLMKFSAGHFCQHFSMGPQ